MAADHGRDLKIKKNGTTIAGCQTKRLSFNAQPVDITNDDDGGFQTLLAGGSGSESLEISIDGVWKDNTLRNAALTPSNDKLLTDVTVAFADGATITGNFFLSSYEENGEYQDSVKFSATLMSSGEWALS